MIALRRLLLPLAALVGLTGAAGMSQAKSVSPDQAPPAWLAYADAATQAVTARLNAELAPAPRVRAVLDATRPAPDQPTPPLVVKLWVNGQGAVTRAEFSSVGDATADADLRALLVGQALAPPPRGMLQPLRIALQLPPPPAQSAAADPPPAGATVH